MSKYAVFLIINLLFLQTNIDDLYKVEKVYSNHFTLDLSLIRKLKIKAIYFSLNSDTVSRYYFDINGNRVSYENYVNKYVQKSIYEYDNFNRIIKREDYSANNKMSFAEEYNYETDHSCKVYRYTDTSKYLYSKTITLDDEKLIIKSRYNQKKELESKSINIYDQNWELEREIKFKSDTINTEHIYTYDSIGKKGYYTVINYQKKGLKDEITLLSYECDSMGNKVKNYHNGSLVSVVIYNHNNKVLSMSYFDKNNVNYKKEIFTYNNNDQIDEHKVIDLEKNTDSNYQCFYNEFGLLIKVIKAESEKQNDIAYTFHYKYFD